MRMTDNDVQQGFPLDVEGDILDDDSCGNNLVVVSLGRSGRCVDLRRWWGASGRGKVGVIVR
jgi:hypothetical protein